MTIIDLRTYCKQIKQLIDTGQTEEAISHCMHILGIYPKHLDTYRVLGEAYLERGEHSEAADIFQRVLSSIPDDFVAHIGMSVIREDDEKLDEAIWHMERAFEVQPSNSTIQSEIRRLYSSREGIEPQKVRLTRGALARMYVKGSLYPQAIGELQAALTEDQNRFDLKILLSDVYFKSGRDNDGIKTSEEVLSKLPYCYGANLLLASFYGSREPKEDAKLYTDRLIELDPYIAYLNDLDSSPSEIPDSAVEIEKFVSMPVILTEGERAVEEIDLIDKDLEVSGQEVISAAAAAEIISETAEEESDAPSEALTGTAAISEEIEPVQPSDWQQEMEDDGTILEDDTKPVLVVPVSEDEVDAIESVEGGVESELEEKGDIPDWLMELADEETSSEMEQGPAIIAAAAVENDVTEEPIQAEIDSGVPQTTADVVDEETLPEMEPGPAIIAAAAVENDVTEKPIQAEIDSGVPQTTEDAMDEETLPEMETELDQPDEETIEPSIERESFQPEIEQQARKPVVDSPDEVISARLAIEAGDKEEALAQYSDLIKSRQNLTTVIIDLEKAAEKYPDDAAVQRKLGDAYLRNHQINEAMQAYSKAEQHL